MCVKKIDGVWKANSGETLTYKPWGPNEGWNGFDGKCLRVGGDMKWYKAVCEATSLPWRYTFNPFCKKPFGGNTALTNIETDGNCV